MFKGAKKTFALGLPEECYDRIKELVGETYRTVPGYIRMIVYNYLRWQEHPDTTADDWWQVK